MPSSKGEPTDPELREKIKEEVKNEEKGVSTLNVIGFSTGPSILARSSLPLWSVRSSVYAQD